MSLPNSVSTSAAQQMHTADSILSSSFDMMGGEGASAAQQLINHMDAYAQQQRQLLQLEQFQQQQQQQQINYHMQSPSHHNSLASSSSPLSVTPKSSPSPSSFLLSPATYNQHLVTTATSATTPLMAISNHHQFNQRHLQQQQQQQQQQHSNYTNLNQQQVTTPTSSPSPMHHRALSQISLMSPTTTATITTTTTPSPQPPSINNNNYTTDNHQTHHHDQQQQQQYTFNIQHHNINHHQMDAQQQQQQQQQQNVAITNGAQNQNGGCPMPQPSLANATAAAPPVATAASSPGPHTPPSSASSPSAVAATAAASATTPASASVPHQHASPYKSCWCFGDSSYHMKILVPAVASGAIIGKGGETIASLQKDSGARVKMSKSHDFYPGTTERVCLITGTPEGIMTVVDFIMDKIREKPDLTTKIIDTESKQTQERDKQVKILVPNSTAGMIIGKGGAYIKQIKEESGSYVQISQKPKDISLQERCITIIGDKENNKNACKMILSKIVEDPQSGTCLNVSYADVNGPVANFNPTGSPYANNQNAINSSTASLNSTLGTSIGGTASAAGLLVNGTGINFSLNLSSPNPNPNLAVASQLLEHIKVAMRNSGYSDSATNEVCQALSVLVKYGVLGMGVGVPHANGAHTTLGSYLGVSALDQHTAAGAATAGNVFGAVGQVNLEQYTAAAAAAAAAAANRPTQSQLEVGAHYDPFRHLGSAATQATTPVSLNNNSFGLTATTGTAAGGAGQTLGASATHSLGGISKSPTPGDLGAKDTKNVEIPEVIVGAILGPNGRSLVEIQHLSGANVQISKKGIFAPGTRNRIVTITGQPSAITKAQFLIEQKINEEETKRARQIPLTTVVN